MDNISDHRWIRPAISAKHYNEIVEGSGVDPRLIEGRYRTITAAEAYALGFSKAQARDGLLIDLLSPAGEISYQLKPDKPRAEIREDGRIKAVKYETRARHDIILDVSCSYFREVTEGTGDLLLTEGAKKADCATSRGIPTICLSGVWNWGRKRSGKGGVKYGRPELLEDWEHIPLEGRRITLLFDADYRGNDNVARAMKNAADRLTERGARVFIADLPGPEKGLDDFVVAGGDLHEVIDNARPYDPTLLTPYIAAGQRDRLREALERVQAEADRETWEGRAGKTDHSVLRALLELAHERGRLKRRAVEVAVGVRELQERAGVGSFSTLTRATARLKDRGRVEKITGDWEKGKANRYRLKFSKGVAGVRRGKGEKPSPSSSPISATGLENFMPHLRWAAPAVPERETRDTPGRQSIPVEPGSDTSAMGALGKDVEFYLDRIAAQGGEATLRDLSTAAGVNDTSKVRRALEDVADADVVEMDPKGKHGARVRLAPEWKARLDERREEGGEFARARRQAFKHRNDRLGYLDRGKADEAPEPEDMPGPERMAEILKAHRDEWRRRDEAERQDARQDTPEEIQAKAERLIETTLSNLGTVRYGLLRDMWTKDQDGRTIDLRRAVRDLGYPLRPHVEHPGELWVYPVEASAPVPTPKPPPEKSGHNGTEVKSALVPTTEPDSEPPPPPVQRPRRLSPDEVLKVKAFMAEGMRARDAREKVLSELGRGTCTA